MKATVSSGLFLLLAFVLALPCVQAQENYLKDEKALQQHATLVTQQLSETKYSEAFESLGQYWPMPANEIQGLESQTIRQLNLVSDRFGSIIGHEFVKERRLKNLVIERTHVIRFERHLVRLVFSYYHNDQGWLLNGFEWDDSMSSLLE